MPPRGMLPALLALVAIGQPQVAGGQPCPVTTTFDPNPLTRIMTGGSFFAYGASFSSPESVEPGDVLYLGDPTTLDGRLGGIAPGSDRPTGQLELLVGFMVCLGLDVRTGSPYTTEVFDRLGALVSSVTGSSPTFELPFWVDTWTGYRVVLTPGTLPGGGRDELTVDNMRSERPVVPVRTDSWGRLKTTYR